MMHALIMLKYLEIYLVTAISFSDISVNKFRHVLGKDVSVNKLCKRRHVVRTLVPINM